MDNGENNTVGVEKLGDRLSSDVILRLSSREGRDDRLYAHSAVLRAKCKYFATWLSDNRLRLESGDSKDNIIELECTETDIDHHIILMRLMYANQDDPVADICYNVRTALGVLKLASRFGCEEIVRDCVRYIESMPWEENEEEEILKTLPTLGSSVAPVYARLQPVDPAILREVFISALTAATREDESLGYFLKLKISAQEQVEYMLVEDDDAPLILADEQLKSEFRNRFRELFNSFKSCMVATLASSPEGDEIPEESILEKLSDLIWASRVLPRINLLQEIVLAWCDSSEDIISFLEHPRFRNCFWNTKLKVMEITSKVLEAVGYGSVTVPPSQRTGLMRVWLPYIRRIKPVLEAESMDETSSVSMDSELCHNIESAMTSLVLSLPSGDQAQILADWLKNEHASYPDLSEAFEVWCFRSKAAKRRLNSVELAGKNSSYSSSEYG